MSTSSSPAVGPPAGKDPNGVEKSPLHYLSVLDGLRGVAILIVVMHHGLYSHVPGGFLGVDLFFVLSGYLITRILLEDYQRLGRIRFDLFYLRRALRLLPALSTAVLISLFYYLYVDSSGWAISWWISALAVLGYVSNFVATQIGPLGPTWSLAVEGQFYAFWPLLLLVLLRRRNLKLLVCVPLGIIASSLLVRLGMVIEHYSWTSISFSTLGRLDTIMMGCLAALVGNLERIRTFLAWSIRWRVAEIIVVGLVLLCLTLSKQAPLLLGPGYTVVAFCFAVLLLTLVAEKRTTLLKGALGSAPLVWIGQRSYSYYLYHSFFLHFLESSQSARVFVHVLVEILRALLPLAAAALSYRFLEVPFLRMKSKLHDPGPPRAERTVAT